MLLLDGQLLRAPCDRLRHLELAEVEELGGLLGFRQSLLLQ